MPSISALECSRCRHRIAVGVSLTVCPLCNGFLFVCYDMEAIKRTAQRPVAHDAGFGIWRYSEVLPDVSPLSLGEGWTPLLRSRQFPGLFVKDEGRNPTETFEDRGMALAVAMARHDGIQQLGIASTGESAGALAAYAAAAKVGAHVFLPQNVTVANHLQCMVSGAKITLVQGLIGDCERVMAEQAGTKLNISALQEPFRLEGLKTIGYELVEQLGWEYPDAILSPTDIVAAAIGKAFDEMEQLGWVAGKRPRIYMAGDESNPSATMVIHDSGGQVVEDGDALASLLDWGREEGTLLSPEGAAAAAAYKALLSSGELTLEDQVVLINPSDGLKYAEATARALRLRPSLPSSLPVGGIITPQ